MQVPFRFATFALGVALLALSASAQGAPGTLTDTRVSLFEMHSDNIHRILSRVSSEYDIPIGLETAAGGTTGVQINLRVQNGTVGDLLDAITSQDSRYKWSLVDGVINVFPISDRDESLRALLETRVRKFVIKEATSKYALKREIMSTPEVKATLESRRRGYVLEAFFNGDEVEVSVGAPIPLSNTTLAGILNTIIKTRHSRYWIANLNEDRKDEFILNF